MNRKIGVLFFCFICSNVYAEKVEYFKIAGELAQASGSFGQAMQLYLSNDLSSIKSESEKIQIEQIFSIADSASICALLSGNLVGSLEMMDENSKKSFRTRVRESLETCKGNIATQKLLLSKYLKPENKGLPATFAKDLTSRLKNLETLLSQKI